ncbi:MAG TPA: hypothetical protein DDZ41_11865 [Flavobacterium sp.]|nr:hypothetical protein [Flavobacterium sp.]
MEIPIFYTLYDFIASPYVGKLYNFTKDSLFLDFYTQINNTYFDVLMKVKIFDLYFQTALFQEYIIPFKVPLFNRKQRENIGLRIDKMITRLSTPILNSSNIYNAAQVVIEVSEKTYPERIEIRKTTLSPINFLAGTTPKNKVNNCAFLEMSNGTKRIANASFDFINLMLQPGVIYICQILSNETVIKEFEIISETTTYLYKLNFNEIDYNPGDVIEFKIGKQEVTEIQFISKKYLIFPEAEFSNIILFEDDYKLIQSYEFTGIHLIKSEFTFQNTNIKRNLIDYIKNIDSKDVPKLTINTGFIPKSDIEIISSLINASRVWLYVSENNLIEMVNETKSIIFDDADRELNSFELEFTINKKRYEENYSF